MIAGSIMALMLSSMISMYTFMNKNNARLLALNDLQNLVNSVYGVLSNEAVCSITFGGLTYDPNNLPKKIPSLIIGNTTYAPGSSYGALTIDSLQWTPGDTPLGVIAVTPAIITTHLANLSINVTANGLSFARQMSFIVGIDPSNTVRICFTTIDRTAACAQLGGTMTAGRCQITLPLTASLTVGTDCSPNGTQTYVDHVGIFVCSQGLWELMKATLSQ